MDREIPKEVRNKERNKKIIRYGAIGVGGNLGVHGIIFIMRSGVEEEKLLFSPIGKRKNERNSIAPREGGPALEEKKQTPPNTPSLLF